MARRTRINHVVIAVAFTLVVGACGAWKTESVLAATPKATVPCWSANGSGEWGLWRKVKPRECAFNGDEAHASQVPLTDMRWCSWGGPTACGHGTFYANSGFLAPTRFCLYRKVIDSVEGDFYTRIRGRVGRGCAWVPGEGRRCGVGRPFRYRVSVS